MEEDFILEERCQLARVTQEVIDKLSTFQVWRRGS